MSTPILVIVAVLAGALLAGIGFYLRTQVLVERNKELSQEVLRRGEEIARLQEELKGLWEVRAQLKEKEALLKGLSDELAALRNQNLSLAQENAALKKEQEAGEEKRRWLEGAEQRFREIFQSLAREVLQGNAEEFLKRSRDQLEALLKEFQGNLSTHKVEFKGLIEPLEKTLKQLDDEVRALEQKREGAYQGILKELKMLEAATQELRRSTTNLDHALRSSAPRGRWGELQLQRIAELAGMLDHVDFDLQVSLKGRESEMRVDMLVHLVPEGGIPVDAKVPMTNYLKAMEATSEEERRRYLEAHARDLLKHMEDLRRKEYHAAIPRSPGFTVMFLPSEAFLIAAFEGEPNLIERAISSKVLIATPLTLFALLRAIAEGWRQYEWTRNAEQFVEKGKELCKKLERFAGGHLASLGDGLRRAVRAYNDAVGSWERRLLPELRRFYELGGFREPPPELEGLEEPSLPLKGSAPSLPDPSDPEE